MPAILTCRVMRDGGSVRAAGWAGEVLVSTGTVAAQRSLRKMLSED
ncbi:hypothetical protein [Arthrobacter sp. H14-L1]|nr:hypothetical protein [Arthrobacter sp. H14-L1]MCY0903517.1 hypothetical protein [Arthrobacter sp. H14-L1]